MKGELGSSRVGHGTVEAFPSDRALRRATIDFSVESGVLSGHVAVEGRSPVAFRGIAELERCLGLGHGHLLLVEGGTEDEPEGSPSLATLTETERQIVQAAVSGASNREIAEATFYSVKSIEAYLTRIYRRFGISGRNELAQVLDLAPPEHTAEQVIGGALARAGSSTPPVAVQLLVV